MVTITIFFAAIFTLLFFILGIVFKGLASAFDSLLESIDELIKYGKWILSVYAAMSVSVIVIDRIIKDGMSSVLAQGVEIAVSLFFIWLLLGSTGGFLEEIIESILYIISDYTSFALEFIADKCEIAYAKFLGIIVKNLDKC